MIISLLFSLSLGKESGDSNDHNNQIFLSPVSLFLYKPSLVSLSKRFETRERARSAFVARDTLSVLAIADDFTASLLPSSSYYYHRTEIIKNRSLGKDGAFQQQIFGKNQRRRLFTSRERRTKRRRFRRNPVVRGRRMGRSSVVLLGIRV